MPNASGYEIAEAIYERYGMKNSPDIVFMTGALSDAQEVFHQELANKDNTLLKPLSPEQMSNVIDIKTRQRCIT